MIDVKGKSVMVTGGESMVGRAICHALEKRGATVDRVPHAHVDLLDYGSLAYRMKFSKPEYVVHAAGWNGGIGWNKLYPATIYYRTTLMGLNVLQACADFHVKGVVSILASCSLPDNGDEVLYAENLWNGSPNESVECHGLAKRNLDAFSRQLLKEEGLNARCCILTNCYGPYDSYHPDKTKVVGALVRRFVEAKQQRSPTVTCWGTGDPLREFMFAPDAGEAITQYLLSTNCPSPMNIGSGQEMSIRRLTEIISYQVGYKGQIWWTPERGDGQMKKLLDSSNMKRLLNVPITSFANGIEETIAWYIANQEAANAKGVSL